jgi:hypothetical protein
MTAIIDNAAGSHTTDPSSHQQPTPAAVAKRAKGTCINVARL